MRLIAQIAVALLAIWLGAGVWFLMERDGLYFPFDEGDYPTSVAGSGFSKHQVDGIEVWVKRPYPGMPTILYFGGNAGHPGRNAPVLAEYGINGFGVVAPRYRFEGRGGDQLVADGLKVADAVNALTGASPDRTVIHGLSLGSGIATQVAAQRPAAGLVLEAPFTRLCDMPGTVLPVLPYCVLSPGDELPTVETITEIIMPVLVQHGARDRLIPVEMGEAVHAAARAAKALRIYPDGDHNDLRLHGSVIDARAFALRVASPSETLLPQTSSGERAAPRQGP